MPSASPQTAATAASSNNTVGMQSPPNASFASTDSASRRSYAGELYGYYYSALSAWGGPSEVKLADNEKSFVLGEAHCGQETTQWTNAKVRAVSYYTYRNRLPTPLANGTDHDAGWGCMIRTGQMMMSEALRRVYKVKLPPQPLRKVKESEMASLADPQSVSGPTSAANFVSSGKSSYQPDKNGAGSGVPSPRNGSTSPIPTTAGGGGVSRQISQEGFGGAGGGPIMVPTVFGLTPEQSETFHRVAAMFYDVPDAPFGIHKLTSVGATAAKVPVGEWFTPTALARTLEAILQKDKALDPLRSQLAIVASYDAVVSMEELDQHFTNKKAVLLLVPLMLGYGTLDASYQKAFLKLLECPLTIGIVGGKPRQSLYFVGHQKDTCFYLDPHTVQPAFVSPQTIGQRCGPRGSTPVSTVDPSMLLCFLFESELDHQMFQEFFFTELRQLTEYPLFTYAQKKKPTVALDDVVDDMDFDDSDGEDAQYGGAQTAAAAASPAPSTAVTTPQSSRTAVPAPSSAAAKAPAFTTTTASSPTATASPTHPPPAQRRPRAGPPPLSNYTSGGSGAVNGNPFMNMTATNDSFNTPKMLNSTAK